MGSRGLAGARRHVRAANLTHTRRKDVPLVLVHLGEQRVAHISPVLGASPWLTKVPLSTWRDAQSDSNGQLPAAWMTSTVLIQKPVVHTATTIAMPHATVSQLSC